MKPEKKRLPPNSLGVCKIEGCIKNAVAFHLCCTHYSKLKKYGDPLAGRTNAGGNCGVEGCSSAIKGRGFCAMHYERWKKHGDPLIARKPVAPCKVEECNEPARGRGWCVFHYDKFRRYGDVLAGGKRRRGRYSQKQKCKIDGCDLDVTSLDFCVKHYAKFKKYGDPLAGLFQDGRTKVWHPSKDGYIYRFDPKSPHASAKQFVFQHRLVMGEKIGRPLRSDESVHHKNGDRSDNRLSNLELWPRGQPAGQRVQDKVKWAREILNDYGDLVDRMK